MIRYTFFAIAILGTAATAIAAVQPAAIEPSPGPSRETVIEKTSPFPVLGPILVEQCAMEDCSDVQG
jgi:hypothetical protein